MVTTRGLPTILANERSKAAVNCELRIVVNCCELFWVPDERVLRLFMLVSLAHKRILKFYLYKSLIFLCV